MGYDERRLWSNHDTLEQFILYTCTWKERQDHHSALQYILCTFWCILTQIEKLPTNIRLATNMKFAGVNIYGHPNIWCESIGWPPRSFSILNWREIDNFINFLQKNHNLSSRAPYHKRKQLWKFFCITIICQSRHTRCLFNTTSDKIYD
jgi:hypothetical protein